MSLSNGNGSKPPFLLTILVGVLIAIIGWNLSATYSIALKVEGMGARFEERFVSFEKTVARVLDGTGGGR